MFQVLTQSSSESLIKNPSFCLLNKDELTDSTHNFIYFCLYLHIVHTAAKSKTIKTFLIKITSRILFSQLRVKNFTFSSHARLRKKFFHFYSALSLLYWLEHTVSSSRDAFESHGAQSATKSPSQEIFLLAFLQPKNFVCEKMSESGDVACEYCWESIFFLPL